MMGKGIKIYLLETDSVFKTQREHKHTFFTKSSEAVSAFEKQVKEVAAEIEAKGNVIVDITNMDPTDLAPHLGKYVKNVKGDTVSIHVLGEYNDKHIDILLYSYWLPLDKTTPCGLTVAKLHTKI